MDPMVIGERLAWAHLPKAAGTATQAMLEAVPGLVHQADPVDSNDKHDTFWRHEDAIAGKLRVMNIRRPAARVLSAAHHKAESGLWPDSEPLPMPTVAEMVESTDPDDLLRWSGRDYDHDLSATFGRAEIDRMYERNPDWCGVERRLYGGTLLS